MKRLRPFKLLLISFVVLIVGGMLLQVYIDLALRRVVAPLELIDKAERKMLWNARYIQTEYGEDDLKRFRATEIPKAIDPAVIRRLAKLRPWVISGVLRRKLESTLNLAEGYLASAGILIEVTEKPRAKRAAMRLELENRLRAFRYHSGGCSFTYVDFDRALNQIIQKPKDRKALSCILAAAEALLIELGRPGQGGSNLLQNYLAEVARESAPSFWSEADYQALKSAHFKLAAKLKEPTVKNGLDLYRKTYIRVGSKTRAETIVRKFFDSLGFDLKTLHYEDRPRAGLNSGGLHYTLSPPGDNRVLIPGRLIGTEHYLAGLVHETGHAAYFSSVDQAFYPFREPSGETGFIEPMADIFAALFLEPECLARSGDPDLLELSKLDRVILHLASPVRNSLDAFVTRARYQMLAALRSEDSLVKIANEVLNEFPNYFSKELRETELSGDKLALYFVAREIEYLISWPDSYQGYVDGGALVGSVLDRYLVSGEIWAGAVKLSHDLKTMFRLGSSEDPKVLTRHLQVDLQNKARMIDSFSSYLGL